MPANLSPEYKDAQEAYRRAREPKERLECLREMLRTIPKHKGTEHLQADLKTRIKELTEELTEHRKGGGRSGPSVAVRPEGAAQVALLGPPNSGKSSLHARLTGSHAVVGPYPFATKVPLPGMLAHEDVHFQLVDLPPISADYLEPWMGNALESADGALLVVDLAEADCLEQVATVRRRLEEKRISLVEGPDRERAGAPRPDGGESDSEALLDPFRLRLPTALVANKSDRLPDPGTELEAFRELAGLGGRALAVSAETGHGLSRMGPLLFDMMGVVRVYTKIPGHHAARDTRPFTLRGEVTVRDVAHLVHRGQAAQLRFARIWGSGEFDGQQVSGDHPVRDRDVVELHW
jgi:ribosome-interacting GTPase 1